MTINVTNRLPTFSALLAVSDPFQTSKFPQNPGKPHEILLWDSPFVDISSVFDSIE